VKGTRTHHTTGEAREVELEHQFEETEFGTVFKLRGGPTGYESFYVTFKGEVDQHLDKMFDIGWHACFGTKGRYDELVIEGAEMRRVFEEHYGPGGKPT
jgi:hypothetical protein